MSKLKVTYANPEGTAAIVTVDGVAAYLIYRDETPEQWEGMLHAVTPEPYVPVEEAPVNG